MVTGRRLLFLPHSVALLLAIFLIFCLSGCDREEKVTGPTSAPAVEATSTTDTDNTADTVSEAGEAAPLAEETPTELAQEAEKTTEKFYEQAKPVAEEPVKQTQYIETGDLSALRERGIIRFVSLTGDNEGYLPRKAIVTQSHRELAERLAQRLKLEPRWLIAETPQQAIEMVQEGRADIVAENLTDTAERREIVAFSQPIQQTSDVLVTGVNGPDISDVKNLKGTELIVLAGSTYAETAKRLVEENPGANLTVREVYLNAERDTLFDMVSKVDNAVTVLHKGIAEDTLQYRHDLKMGAEVSEPENIAWAMRLDAKRLKTRVNNFLTRTLVTALPERTNHWHAIKKSGVLRFATYNGPTSYYIWRGTLRGFDYAMVKSFADKHKLELKVIVVPYEEDLVDWVAQGKADIGSATTTITEERRKKGVEFSEPFTETPQNIISNRKKPQIATLGDLAGRTIVLRAYSAFIETAETLKENGLDVNIQIAPPDESFAEVLNKVAAGEYDATIEDGYIAKMQAALRPNLQIGLQVSDPLPQGLMVKKGNNDLLKQVNRFMRRFTSSDEHEKLLAAYFEPDKHLVQRISARVVPGEDLSPYDKLVKKNSLERDFDWRLITAQMWQESNFNPKAVSPVGAQGLLQVMPRTGADMGYPPPLFEPDRNLEAGVKYMEWIRNRFKDPLPLSEKLWFTLASYNAGLGHVYDAQRLAKELGLDPTKWFDNVEVAMLKLSEPRYFEKARYGYARGAEPVAYVRKISKLYVAYTNVAEGEVAGEIPTESSGALTFRVSAQSCRYDCWTPSACAPLQRPQGQMSPRSGDAPCPQQSAARPSLQEPGQSPLLPPAAEAAGWNRSGSGASP
ncbi:Membrane-bound lytic murein transglycosylase F precursor [Microbulbifer aggregans]|uniref:Membrane-bound lytic murein transglycosylase F n=1 Tax=Microbulbifer aggregans TaxID=1769779 RepID=A0A1C9WBM7_9GAMM|nr:Membrane-bound lytic murein transglycosylase F precursor [Microbulbifer aggregans]